MNQLFLYRLLVLIIILSLVIISVIFTGVFPSFEKTAQKEKQKDIYAAVKAEETKSTNGQIISAKAAATAPRSASPGRRSTSRTTPAPRATPRGRSCT